MPDALARFGFGPLCPFRWTWINCVQQRSNDREFDLSFTLRAYTLFSLAQPALPGTHIYFVGHSIDQEFCIGTGWIGAAYGTTLYLQRHIILHRSAQRINFGEAATQLQRWCLRLDSLVSLIPMSATTQVVKKKPRDELRNGYGNTIHLRT